MEAAWCPVSELQAQNFVQKPDERKDDAGGK